MTCLRSHSKSVGEPGLVSGPPLVLETRRHSQGVSATGGGVVDSRPPGQGSGEGAASMAIVLAKSWGH